MADKISVLYSEEEVCARIREMGEQISKDYAGKTVHLIGILKGATFFICELAKRITVPVTLDFMSVSSYGDATESSGIVKINKDLDEPLDGRDVIVVEDIVDTGNTLSYLLDNIKKRGSKSVKLCALLDKPERRKKTLRWITRALKFPMHLLSGTDWTMRRSTEICPISASWR